MKLKWGYGWNKIGMVWHMARGLGIVWIMAVPLAGMKGKILVGVV